MPATPLAPAARRAVLITLLAAWALLFAPQLLTGKVFVLGDAAAYRPYAEFSQARFAATGERTDWNPYVFLGIPARASLADPRPQWLPGPLLAAWDAAGRLPLPPLAPLLLAHLAGMLAMAALARSLWRGGPAGLALAALAWGLTPAVLAPLAFGHDAQTWTVALTPVALWLAVRVIEAPDGAGARLAALGLAATLGLAMLGGHPQFVAVAGGLVLVLGVERAIARGRAARLAWIAGAVVLGAALSAAAWWPALAYVRDSVRGTADFATRESADFSASARDLLALVWPRAAGFGGDTYWGGLHQTDFPYFLGGIAAVLAVLGAATRRRDGARGAALVLAALAVFGVAAALGTRFAPLHALLAALPMGATFRTPVTLLGLTLLAAALLSARGADALTARLAAGRWRGAAAFAALVLVVLGLASVAAPGLGRQASEQMMLSRARPNGTGGVSVDDDWATRAEREGPRGVRDLQLRLALLAVAAVAAAAVARTRASFAPGVVTALAAVAALELAAVGAPILARATGPRSALAAPPPSPLGQAAARDPLHRAFPLDRAAYFSNDWVAWRAKSVAGLHGAAPARWDRLRTQGLLARDGFVRALAVKYVAGSSFQLDDTTHWERLPGGVMSRRDALPRAVAVPRVEVVTGEPTLLATLADARFDPSQLALVEDAAARGEYPGSALARIAWKRDDPDRIELDVEAPGRAFVVVADAWLPGWTATLDGRDVPLHRVDYILRGVAVAAGRHVLAMRYAAPGAAAGAWVSRLAWLLAIGVGAWMLRARRAATRPASAAA